MTKVYYEERGKRHRLIVQGHAAGSEVACAGISAILYALEGYLAMNEMARLREVRMKSADVVLADVPCSGLGVMGKKRDIKYRQSKEAVAELNALQKAIVRQAAAYVKTGGILLYSTCTINPVENEEMVDFICREMDFSPESIEAYLPDMQGKETAKQGYIQLLPQIHDTDGFFFARLRKKDNVKR